MPPADPARPMGHEAIGRVEAVGRDVERIKVGDLVIMPFAYSDGSCMFCDEGLQTSCVHGGFFGAPDVGGAQAEALRIPHADGTLYPINATHDDTLMASVLTLSDVMGTGHHAALMAWQGGGGDRRWRGRPVRRDRRKAPRRGADHHPRSSRRQDLARPGIWRDRRRD
jgi:threonine dehydrogenase-like Zn-dependent dehydrogenase